MGALQTMTRGISAYRDGHYIEARRLCERALDEATSAENLEVSIYALQMWLAHISLQTGDYKNAQKCIDNALKCANKEIDAALNEEYAKTADIAAVQWHLYSVLERHHEAIEGIAQLVEHEKERFGVDSLHYANALNAQGVILYNAGQALAAEAPLRRAMSIRERILGVDDESFADSLINLGTSYVLQNNATSGLALIERGLTLRRHHLRANHIMVGSALYVRAGALIRMRNLKKSEEDYSSSLKIFEMELLPDHRHISFALSGIGQSLVGQGKFKEAIEPLKRAISIADSSSVQKDIQLSAALGPLGQAYLGVFQFKDAEEQFKRALYLCEHNSELKVGVERGLLDSVMVASLLQGKVGDVMRAYPDSMRAKYTSSLQGVVNMVDAVVEFGKKQLPPSENI